MEASKKRQTNYFLFSEKCMLPSASTLPLCLIHSLSHYFQLTAPSFNPCIKKKYIYNKDIYFFSKLVWFSSVSTFLPPFAASPSHYGKIINTRKYTHIYVKQKRKHNFFFLKQVLLQHGITTPHSLVYSPFPHSPHITFSKS